MFRTALALALLAACGAELAKSNSGDDNQVDASIQTGNDSSVSIDAPLPIDAPTCANGRKVYLEFGGATITQGPSDATQNRAAWMGVATATMPPYKGGSATLAQDVTNRVKATLAQFPNIEVVTTRPASGPYMMIGFGGTRVLVNVPYTLAVNRLDCGDMTAKSDLAWVFDDVPSSQKAADYAIGAIGFGLGLVGTNDPNDCMCSWLTNCQQAATACTLGANVTARDGCGLPNPHQQNEVAAFQGFCN